MNNIDKKLLRALSNRQWQKALSLLEQGANPTVRNTKGYNALLLLADGARVEVAQPILQQLADLCLKKGCLLSDTANDGTTVLHLCAGNSDLFSHCLMHNPSCTTLSKTKKNILYYVAHNPNIPVALVEKCITLGADIHHKDNDGNNAFDYFTHHGFLGAHYLLSLVNHGYSPTNAQIFAGCLVALRTTTTDNDMMLYLAYAQQHGVNFNAVDSEHNSLLELAVRSGRIQAVEYMLNNGACVQHKNMRYPLGLSLPNINHHNATQLMDLLVQHGLDINDAGTHLSQQTMVHQVMYYLPFTHFDRARANELIGRLRSLLQYGGDIHKPEETGMTPLSLGLMELTDEYPNFSQLDTDVQQYVNDVLDLLLEYGCDLDRIDGNGTGHTGMLGQLLRRCETTELLEYKIASLQKTRLEQEIGVTENLRGAKKM